MSGIREFLKAGVASLSPAGPGVGQVHLNASAGAIGGALINGHLGHLFGGGAGSAHGYVASAGHLPHPSIGATVRLSPSVNARTSVALHPTSGIVSARVAGGVALGEMQHVHFGGTAPSPSLQAGLSSHGIGMSHGTVIKAAPPWQRPREDYAGPEPSLLVRIAAPLSLLDHAQDEPNLRALLGHRNPRFDMSHLAGKVRRGDPLTVYRATGDEHAIEPGHRVTTSRRQAEHDGLDLGLSTPRVLEAKASPRDLIPHGQNRFTFAPADPGSWHADQVREALLDRRDVPIHVLADYPHLSRRMLS